MIRWSCLAATIGLACAISIGIAQINDTKKFKETGTEYIVTSLAPSSLPQPIFAEARERHGADTQVWCGVMHQFSENNVGGKGNSVAFEQVHFVADDPTIPTGIIVYIMKYETMADGDRFVMAGYFMPQTDGSLVGRAWLIPGEGTGRFAGANAILDNIRPIPEGYVIEGTISTVGATK